jgi:hypothetical protein
MRSEKLKQYLLEIAEKIDENTDLEDIYAQLALLADIDESEEQEKNGEVHSQEEVEKMAKEWLK